MREYHELLEIFNLRFLLIEREKHILINIKAG